MELLNAHIKPLSAEYLKYEKYLLYLSFLNIVMVQVITKTSGWNIKTHILFIVDELNH